MKPSHLLLLFGILLASCASAPSQEKVASYDYGDCPVNHETVIKERFKNGLLNTYSGEPQIWPPQPYWFRDPLRGGKIITGYLVPVLANQSRGNNLFMGKRLYGFIFHNDVLLREINPNLMTNLRISEAVGPIPDDGRGWMLANSQSQGNQSIQEFTLPNEGLEIWSELVTIQTLHSIPHEISLETMMTRAGDEHRNTCEFVSQTIIESTSGTLTYEQTTRGCQGFEDEVSLRKSIRGARSVFEVSYTSKNPFSDEARHAWLSILEKVAPKGHCD
ncbi:MAG: hypothetical protein Q8K46_02570 [Deltaproteobacteria bacterium]|nr:hypothetical protein [Deltaproteobacteria bacterium]